MQNKANIEYQDSMKNDPRKSKDQHAKDALVTFEQIYKSHNKQLDDETLHIPMTSQTKPKTSQTKKSSKTEDSII